jgi:hypothetical protein
VFIDALRGATSGSYEILADYRHPDAAIGANLDEYIRKIDSADAVILLLTPAYKARVGERGGTGVYAEFRRIYDRLLAAEERQSHGRDFLLLPIVFIGSHDSSCPPEIRHVIARDLTWLHTVPDRASARRRSMKGQPPIRRQVHERFRPFVREIVERIGAIGHTKSTDLPGLFGPLIIGERRSPSPLHPGRP